MKSNPQLRYSCHMKINVNAAVMAQRKRRGLTQKQLATKARLGLNHIDIVRIERYGWVPPELVRRRLAEVLGVAEDVLFGQAAATRSF